MIIGVDIGGTKTFVACFAENGKLLKEVRFETSHNYEDFLSDLKNHADRLDLHKAKVACVAVPGLIDRKAGFVHSLGNLPWKDIYIKDDLAKALGVKKICIENDSKLAGLAEARYIADRFKRVFYLTLSTGIGGALIVNGKLVKELLDLEIGKMPLEYNGKIQDWEEFASGRAFFNKYGQKAVDVTDKKTWGEFSQLINLGLGIVCANFQVEAIVFGGGLGQHFSRFQEHLMPYLETTLHPNIKRPLELLPTHYRGQSVIYGCYEYGKNYIS